ncbi:PDR/VanB family oxidoreductase [Microvirga sesbaniae]|uniref:PDR/VanB family oxidoreductase n=1 Tax=Microvirga sesbaniae TaxID=681392 RepID=UPI0021C5F68A|nr:PDR/VanB family oxidoreductase [Microvirga sp. HBU67692]
MERATFPVIVTAVTAETETVNSYELSAVDTDTLPAFSAGSHIDLHLGNGLVRSYSLVNCQSERRRYVIGVHRDAEGRGGSRLVHDSLHVGQTVVLSGPRNNFPLREDARHTVLMGGGIGITPLLAMMTRLSKLGRPYEVHYVARTRSSAPFLNRIAELRKSAGADIRVSFSQEEPATRPDIASIVNSAPDDAHLYCCGPSSLLEAFKEATARRPAEFVHLEHFGSAETPTREGEFQVELARSGVKLDVKPGQSILDVLIQAGMDVAFSCEQGVCGTCEVAVLEGIPDHRDTYLTPSEREKNASLMICCSRSFSDRLVLDL